MPCRRCRWTPPLGVTKRAYLCAPCMHEDYEQRARQQEEGLWPVCQCKRSRYWQAIQLQQRPPRQGHLQILDAPAPVPPSTRAGHGPQVPQHSPLDSGQQRSADGHTPHHAAMNGPEAPRQTDPGTPKNTCAARPTVLGGPELEADISTDRNCTVGQFECASPAWSA